MKKRKSARSSSLLAPRPSRFASFLTFSNVVVRVSLELDRDTGSEESSSTLTGASLHTDPDRVPRESLLSVFLRDLVRERRAERSIGVDDFAVDLDGETVLDGGLGLQGRGEVELAIEDARQGRKGGGRKRTSSINMLSRRRWSLWSWFRTR